MGIYLKLPDFENLIERTQNPYVVNDHAVITERDAELIDSKTRTIFTNKDTFSSTPQCECGELYGAFHEPGTICNTCHTPVKDAFDTDLQPKAWIRSPEGVAKYITPVVWLMLTERFMHNDFSLVEWLCNTDYVSKSPIPTNELQELAAMGIKRGYNNFVANFYDYYDKMSSLKYYAKRSDNGLRDMLHRFRHLIFTRYLPLTNKSLLIIEETHYARYMDAMIEPMLDAITLLQGIDTPMSSFTLRQRENRAVKALSKIAKYSYESFHKQIAKKGGLLRKELYSNRVDFTTRSVITSNTDPHRYDTLKISWGQGVTMFRMHLINLLGDRGFTPAQAFKYLMAHTCKTSPLLKELFAELMANTPGGRGFACFYVEN